MILDCHIHLDKACDPPEIFAQKRRLAGVDGGMLLSLPPASFDNATPQPNDAEKRIKHVMQCVEGQQNLYPFFFIDPLEDDAAEQVAMADEAGIAGFKAICCHHYPQDDRAMKIWERIAKTGKPLLLHSGILYNDGPSADYNRPGNFEHLFYIPNLRFALAHISWPWVDELVAVFGKWNYWNVEASSTRVSAEMFVDVTPGTPAIYREEALRKVLTVGYPSFPSHLLFGTDAISCYDSERVARQIQGDKAIYQNLGLSDEEQENIFSKNLLRFLGKE